MKDEWVRVEDISELAPGMAVDLRPCGACGKPERHTIKTHPQKYSVDVAGNPIAFVGVETVDGGCLPPKPGTRPGIPDFRVKQGTVWRMVLGESEAAVVVARKLERIR